MYSVLQPAATQPPRPPTARSRLPAYMYRSLGAVEGLKRDPGWPRRPLSKPNSELSAPVALHKPNAIAADSLGNAVTLLQLGCEGTVKAVGRGVKSTTK